VKDMVEEFRGRITKKRELIEKTKTKCKEFALRDTMIICDRCKQDLAPLKTFDFISADLHHAKCVFGSFRRVEVEDALQSTDYEQDRDFCKLYSEMHEDELNEGG